MRRRLIFTYSIVIFLTIVFAFSAAAYFFSSSSADYHSQFTVDHSHTYLQGLEDYYSQNGTWKGVEAYFTSPDLSPVELVFMQQEQVALLSPKVIVHMITPHAQVYIVLRDPEER